MKITPIELLILLVILGGLLFGIGSCSNGCVADESQVRNVLQDEGYSNIQLKGYKWFACSEDDWTHEEFSATNINGRLVRGTVCCGIFKDCTVRISR